MKTGNNWKPDIYKNFTAKPGKYTLLDISADWEDEESPPTALESSTTLSIEPITEGLSNYTISGAQPSQVAPAPGGEAKNKRAPSAYMLFCSEMRAGVKAANADKSFGDIAKILGSQWTALSDAEKKVWQDKAAASK